jgi:transposase
MPVRTTYDTESVRVVTIVRETGKPITEMARDLRVDAGTSGNWVHEDRMPTATS